MLQELSSWCLNDLKTKMNRRKIETLVTIHVHQRDVFEDLARLHRSRKGGLDAGDFEWLKQARFYWRPDAKDDHEAVGVRHRGHGRRVYVFSLSTLVARSAWSSRH